MPNTRGLDDDLDGVELVRDLQLFFDIKVLNEEAERIFTVGEFHDLLLRRIPANEADRKCAGAMTFFRLRGALRRLGYVVPHQFDFAHVPCWATGDRPLD